MNKDLRSLLLKLLELREGKAQMVFFASIFGPTVIAVRNEISEFKKDYPDIEEIDFILNSPGGLADDAYRLIRTLRKNFKIVNVIIPFWAKSAATLFSLGANNIIMDEFGEFGPLDAQIARVRDDSPVFERESALNDEHSVGIIESKFKIMYEQMFIRLYEHEKINIPKIDLSEQLLKNLSRFYKPLLSQINPYKLGEKKRSLDIGAQYAKRILLQFGAPKTQDSARELVDYLIHECPDHGYVIDKDVMENFVANIYDSTKFGKEYKDALQALSMYLIKDGDEENLIGFINKDEANKGNLQNIQTQKSESDAVNKNAVNQEIEDLSVVDESTTTDTIINGEKFVNEIIEKVTTIKSN